MLLGVVLAAGLLFVGLHFIDAYLPVMSGRIAEFSDDAYRYDIYTEAIANISFFGRGLGESYAHNVFLEFLQDYGIVGLTLFSAVLSLCFVWVWRAFSSTRNTEVLWLLGLMVLQLTAQQFSLNIFTDMFWTVLALSIGVHLSAPAFKQPDLTLPFRRAGVHPPEKQSLEPSLSVGEH